MLGVDGCALVNYLPVIFDMFQVVRHKTDEQFDAEEVIFGRFAASLLTGYSSASSWPTPGGIVPALGLCHTASQLIFVQALDNWAISASGKWITHFPNTR